MSDSIEVSAPTVTSVEDCNPDLVEYTTVNDNVVQDFIPIEEYSENTFNTDTFVTDQVEHNPGLIETVIEGQIVSVEESNFHNNGFHTVDNIPTTISCIEDQNINGSEVMEAVIDEEVVTFQDDIQTVENDEIIDTISIPVSYTGDLNLHKPSDIDSASVGSHCQIVEETIENIGTIPMINSSSDLITDAMREALPDILNNAEEVILTADTGELMLSADTEDKHEIEAALYHLDDHNSQQYQENPGKLVDIYPDEGEGSLHLVGNQGDEVDSRFECKVCFSIFLNSESLSHHQAEHPFCYVCGQLVQNLSLLNLHLEQMHGHLKNDDGSLAIEGSRGKDVNLRFEFFIFSEILT